MNTVKLIQTWNSLKARACVACLMLGMVFASPTTHAQPRNDAHQQELDVRADLEREGYMLMQQKRYRDVADLVNRYISAQERTGSGVWKAAFFTQGVTRHIADEVTQRGPDAVQDFETQIKSALQGHALASDMALAVQIHARYLRHHALRNTRPWQDIPEPAKAEIDRIHHEAVGMLGMRITTPWVWKLLLELLSSRTAYASRGDGTSTVEVLQRAAAQHGDYHDLYFRALHFAGTAWNDSPNKMAAIQATIQAAQSGSRRDGMSMRARVTWVAVATLPQLFRQHDFAPEWPTLKASFDHLLSQYPSDFNRNAYAHFACRAGDLVTFRQLDEQLGRHIWGFSEMTGRAAESNEDMIRRCRASTPETGASIPQNSLASSASLASPITTNLVAHFLSNCPQTTHDGPMPSPPPACIVGTYVGRAPNGSECTMLVGGGWVSLRSSGLTGATSSSSNPATISVPLGASGSRYNNHRGTFAWTIGSQQDSGRSISVSVADGRLMAFGAEGGGGGSTPRLTNGPCTFSRFTPFAAPGGVGQPSLPTSPVIPAIPTTPTVVNPDGPSVGALPTPRPMPPLATIREMLNGVPSGWVTRKGVYVGRPRRQAFETFMRQCLNAAAVRGWGHAAPDGGQTASPLSERELDALDEFEEFEAVDTVNLVARREKRGPLTASPGTSSVRGQLPSTSDCMRVQRFTAREVTVWRDGQIHSFKTDRRGTLQAAAPRAMAGPLVVNNPSQGTRTVAGQSCAPSPGLQPLPGVTTCVWEPYKRIQFMNMPLVLESTTGFGPMQVRVTAESAQLHTSGAWPLLDGPSSHLDGLPAANRSAPPHPSTLSTSTSTNETTD